MSFFLLNLWLLCAMRVVQIGACKTRTGRTNPRPVSDNTFPSAERDIVLVGACRQLCYIAMLHPAAPLLHQPFHGWATDLRIVKADPLTYQ
jgi:hypothetical protein